MTSLIIAHPHTGLGNRLRCIASLIRIARRIDARFILGWPVNHQCAAPFEDLFDEPFDQGGQLLQDHDGEPGGDVFILEPNCQVRVITAEHLQSSTIHAKAAYFYLLENNPGEIEPRAAALREAGEILGNLRLNPYVAAQLEKSERALSVAQRVGVHVRRGDIDASRKVELDCYFKRLEGDHNDAQIFLSSDDEDVIEAFKAKYGNRVEVYPARSRKREDRIAVQDALIEMLLLSRTRHIIAGPSSFSEVAAMIGGQRRDVLLPRS